MINILIIDDHPAVGKGTKAILENEVDIQTDVINDSEITLELITKRKYDIYLVDLYMPKLNGIELTKLILRNNPNSIILIYTGFDIPIHYNLLIEDGASGFISKTDTKEQLITAIRCALSDEAVVPFRLLKQLRRVNTSPTTKEDVQNLGTLSLSTEEKLFIYRFKIIWW